MPADSSQKQNQIQYSEKYYDDIYEYRSRTARSSIVPDAFHAQIFANGCMAAWLRVSLMVSLLGAS
jgi:hypothetical protein